MDALLSLLTGGQNALLMLLAAIVGALGIFMGGRISGASRERDKNRAKEADGYEKHLEDIARAADAGSRVTGRVSDDPRNRDRTTKG